MNKERLKDEVLEALVAGRITARDASFMIQVLEQTHGEGYLKRCRDCGKTIYMHRDYHDHWRPYESWAAGNVDEGTWVDHECSGHTNGGGKPR